jgi:hypothetical protein
VTVTAAVLLRSMAKDTDEPPKTPAQRKAAERKRLKKAGYVQLSGQVSWVPKQDVETAKQYLQQLRDRHDKRSKD